MTAGEVHRAGDKQSGHSAAHAIPRGLPALTDAEPALANRSHGDVALADTVAALLAADPALDEPLRRTIEALLQRHHQLVADVARLRDQREEWIVSALTYKALYERYSGQSPRAPNDRLMREKESMRRTIREQLREGAARAAMPGHSLDSVSIS